MTLPANKIQNVRRRAVRAMVHTCPASRHLLMMADQCARGEVSVMIRDDPKYWAETMYSVLESLWKLRRQLEPNPALRKAKA